MPPYASLEPLSIFFGFSTLSAILTYNSLGYKMKQRFFEVWIFDVGAGLYDLFTANPVWSANCACLLDHVPVKQNMRQVLDLGVGPGVSAVAMGQRRSELRFIGFDFSHSMLRTASNTRRKAGWSPERLCLLRGDALHLPLKDGKQDAVTGHSFLYLLPDHHLALSEAHRVLRPGGYVAFLEPHAGQGSWSWLVRQASSRLFISVSLWRLYSRWHRCFSRESLGLSLAQAGFANIKMEVTLGGFGIFGRAQKPESFGPGS
jgi:ubiquinone/menaquinone biosynthesis C-methylase UbiE